MEQINSKSGDILLVIDWVYKNQFFFTFFQSDFRYLIVSLKVTDEFFLSQLLVEHQFHCYMELCRAGLSCHPVQHYHAGHGCVHNAQTCQHSRSVQGEVKVQQWNSVSPTLYLSLIWQLASTSVLLLYSLWKSKEVLWASFLFFWGDLSFLTWSTLFFLGGTLTLGPVTALQWLKIRPAQPDKSRK